MNSLPIITLRKPRDDEAESLYQLMISDEQWTEFNGPYFGYVRPTYDEFLDGLFAKLKAGDQSLAIDYDGRLIGTVSYYWEDEQTRWLEAGIIIYDSHQWGRGLGRKTLVPWVTHLFETLEIERVGMTTWSGNPRMVASAESIGFQVEGRLRKVRYYKGVYYDSIKLGVTREEWESKQKNTQAQDSLLAGEL